MSNIRGFTLIEISIALVIIGLITGGIMLGQTLIRSSELLSIVTDIEKFEAARMTFRSKYNCIPGDCQSAADFGLGANGNNNYYVDHYITTGMGGVNEAWLFWVHLANAELISGNYTGKNGDGQDGGVDAIIGQNIPASKVSGVGYSIYTPFPTWSTWSPSQDAGGLPRPITDFYYTIGRDKPSHNYLTRGGFLSPIEAKSLDDKYDDGQANDGKFRVAAANNQENTLGCTSGLTPYYSYTKNALALCDILYMVKN